MLIFTIVFLFTSVLQGAYEPVFSKSSYNIVTPRAHYILCNNSSCTVHVRIKECKKEDKSYTYTDHLLPKDKKVQIIGVVGYTFIEYSHDAATWIPINLNVGPYCKFKIYFNQTYSSQLSFGYYPSITVSVSMKRCANHIWE